MIRILQSIWNWLIKIVCMGLVEDKPTTLSEANVIEDYSRRIEQFKAMVRCILAEHYRACLLLESEKRNLSESTKRSDSAESSEDDTLFTNNRFFSGQSRVEYLQDRVISTKQEVSKALNQLNLLQEELTIATLRLQDAQTKRRAAELQIAAENWRLESELGLNKGLEGLKKMEQETRDMELRAKLTSETNDLLFGESDSKGLKE